MRPSLRTVLFGTPVAVRAAATAWPDAQASLDADFANDRYYWNGQQRLRSSLVTVAGAPVFSTSGVYIDTADRLKFPDLSWWNAAEGTMIVDYDKPTNVTNSTLFSLSGSGGNPRLEMYQQGSGGGHQAFLFTTTNALSGTALGVPPIYPRRGREILSIKDGQVCSGVNNGSAVSAMSATPYANTQTFALAAIGYRARFSDQPFLGNIRRIRFYPARLSEAAMFAKGLETTRTNLHLLGDSFATARLMQAIETGLYALAPAYRVFTVDGTGGSYLKAQAARYNGGTVTTPTETGAGPSGGTNNGNGTYTYPGTPLYWDRTLIIMDGGLSDPDPIAQIASIISKNTTGRWLYVQEGYDSTWTPSQVSDRLALDASIKAAYPNNFVDTYAYMRANGGGSTIGSNGGEVWAANNYTDTLHPGATGDTNLGNCIAAAIDSRGW